MAQKQDISEDHRKNLNFFHKSGKNSTFPDSFANSENFEWSNVENGVRMQKLWPVKVGQPKLPKKKPTNSDYFGPE